MKLQTIAVVSALLLGTCGAALGEQCRLQEPKAPAGKAAALARELAASNPCSVVPGLTAPSLASIWAALLSRPVTGGKRFEAVPPPGTPTGRILPGEEGVTFELQAVLSQAVQRLQVTKDARTVLDVRNPRGPTVIVPSMLVVPGNSYEWALTTRSAAYRGRFEIPRAEEIAEVETRLAALAKADLSAEMRLLYAAAIYDEAELYDARERALSQLRTRVVSP